MPGHRPSLWQAQRLRVGLVAVLLLAVAALALICQPSSQAQTPLFAPVVAAFFPAPDKLLVVVALPNSQAKELTGRLRVELEPVDPSQIAHAVLDTIRPAALAKKIRILDRLEQGIPAVRADPARLQQVLWNLLSNAVKFTPEIGRAHV